MVDKTVPFGSEKQVAADEVPPTVPFVPRGVDKTRAITASNAALLARLRIPAERGDGIDRAELKKRLGIASDYLALRIFSQLDRDKDGIISRTELVQEVKALIDASPRERLRFAFNVHDDDGNGFIDRVELLGALNVGLKENAMVVGPQMVDNLASAMFAEADTDRDGRISFAEFEEVIGNYPGIYEQLTLGDLRWLGLGPDAPEPGGGKVAALTSLRSSLVWWVFVGMYVAGNLTLFLLAFLRYRDAGANVFIQLARGCGACLNLHGAMILVPMMRRTFTVLGRTTLGRILIDDHVRFHRLIGDAAFYLAVGHTVAHLLNLVTLSSSKRATAVATFGWALATGVLLLVVHAVMWAMARTKIRRSGRFELFALAHRLWPAWLVLLLVHGPVAWRWMALPVAIFLFDKFGRRVIRGARARDLDVLPSGVTRLTIWKPPRFKHEAADYAFIRIPALAKAEWHPFTISSAPERSDAITFHIRSGGNWTSALQKLAKERKPGDEPLKVDIDGPYGTPSARIFEHENVVLVAAGIGVTPFASVLESLLERRRRGTPMVVKRVHFIWVCREQHAFEWFAKVLQDVERGAPDLFSIHIYMTSGREDMRSAMLQVAMGALYKYRRMDLVTGLASRTMLGAPDWEPLIGKIVGQCAPLPVSAFYCGPPALGKIVSDACMKSGVIFRQEHF